MRCERAWVPYLYAELFGVLLWLKIQRVGVDWEKGGGTGWCWVFRVKADADLSEEVIDKIHCIEIEKLKM